MTSSKPSSGDILKTIFGLRGTLAKPAVHDGLKRFRKQASAAFEEWKATRWAATGVDPDRVTPASRKLASAYEVGDLESPSSLLYAIESYYLGVLRRVLWLRLPGVCPEWLLDPLFPECEFSNPDAVAITRLTEMPLAGDDLFGSLYEHLFPAAVRRSLGEFFTPAWLATALLEQAVGDGPVPARIVDPACGSGAFLLAAARFLSQQKWPPQQIAAALVGYDLNPLAVLTARANLLLALFRSDSIKNAASAKPPFQIERRDTLLLEQVDEPFPLVIGNPPWINWDRLPPAYRERTRPLWETYGLFNLSGSAARYGGAKKEIATLLLLRAADKLLAEGGRLAFVLPLSILQTGKAGEGFRRLRIVPADMPLRMIRVDDYSRRRPFPGVHSAACTVVLEKGRPTSFPVPFFVHRQNGMDRHDATPGDPADPLSPWRLSSEQKYRTKNNRGGRLNRYTACLGANTGGANGVFWLEILEKTARGTLRIRNLPATGKRSVALVETEIEPDFIYPLLRWKGIARNVARPTGYILLPQDAERRIGVDEERLRTDYPLTWQYLKRFEKPLRERAAFRKLHRAGVPFYSMYNVARPTLAPIKVVWRRMDTDLRAAVVTETDDPYLGRRCLVPQETCVLIPMETLEEAGRVCDLLNSEEVRERVRSLSVPGGKGFGSPGILRFL